VTSPDPLFTPRLPADEVTRRCADAAVCGDVVPDDVAHAIVACRVAVVADPDVLDGPIGRFIRTGAVPRSPGPAIWWPLYGPMFIDLPAGVADVAASLSTYLTAHAGRGPVDGWPDPSGHLAGTSVDIGTLA
jgi:hypothetical protein